jgi:hypothetical protein
MSYCQRSDQVTLFGHKDIGHNDEAAVRTTGKRRDRIFDLSSATDPRNY